MKNPVLTTVRMAGMKWKKNIIRLIFGGEDDDEH